MQSHDENFERALRIRLLILDCDGVLTDGRILMANLTTADISDSAGAQIRPASWGR